MAKEEKDLEKILKALANKRRLAILKILKYKKVRAVGEIAKDIKLSLKATSKHLAVLYAVDIVEREQKSLRMLYSLSSALPKAATQILLFL